MRLAEQLVETHEVSPKETQLKGVWLQEAESQILWKGAGLVVVEEELLSFLLMATAFAHSQEKCLELKETVEWLDVEPQTLQKVASLVEAEVELLSFWLIMAALTYSQEKLLELKEIGQLYESLVG